MVDVVSPEVRSRMMAGIGGRSTCPEIAIRRAMHARGFRFRLHRKELPGTPDLVFPRYRAAVFVHGCFWHRHPGCRHASTPSTRADFWQKKFETNVLRDHRVESALLDEGWRVAIIWECSLRKGAADVADGLAYWLAAADRSVCARVEFGSG